jgi:hypothetical protein
MKHKKITLDYLKELVESITELDILKETRDRSYVDARRVFCKLAMDNVPLLNNTALAKFLGQNHATTLHAMTTFNFLYSKDYIITSLYDKCYNKLHSKKLQIHIKDEKTYTYITQVEALLEQMKEHLKNNEVYLDVIN